MHWAKIASVGALTSSTIAAPSPELIARAPGCGQVNAIISALNQVSTASDFCSAYLAQTTTTTVISTSVMPETTTDIIDKTRTKHTVVTSDLTSCTSTTRVLKTANVTVTGSTTVTITTCSLDSTPTAKLLRPTLAGPNASVSASSSASLARRATTTIAPATTPARLRDTPSAKISKACSCFIPSASTVTQTSYSTVSTTSLSIKNVTHYARTTETSTTVSTIGAVSTLTSTVTSTVTSTPTATVNYCGCHNEGLQWAIYNNLIVDSYGHALGDFSPEDFKSLTSAASGNITSISGLDVPDTPATLSIYGQHQQQDATFVRKPMGRIVNRST